MIIEVNTFNEIHNMKVTAEKYNKLKNMGLVNAVNYSINDRVAIIIQEV